MADQQLDLGTLLKEQFGASLSKVNADGSAQIVVAGPDGLNSVQRFDTNKFIKDNGLDPMKVKVQYNSPDEALDDNPIGFLDSVKLSVADPKKRVQDLEGKYGAGNVVQDQDGLKINDKGVWKKADPGFMAGIMGSLPEMGGGVGGAAIGGALGTAVFPGPGTAVGALIGGSIGGALATVVKNEGLEKLNMRTEEDGQAAYDTFGRELVNNLIWGSVLGVGGAAVKIAAKGTAGVVGRAFNTIADKSTLAEFGEKFIRGSNAVDWKTVQRTGDDAKAVLAAMGKQVEYGKQSANRVTAGLDPATQETTKIISESMNRFKISAYREYGSALKTLDQAGIPEVKINIAEASKGFKSDLIKLGLLDKVDGVHKISTKSADAQRIVQIFDSPSLSALSDTFDQLERVIPAGGEMRFKQVQQLNKSIDNILETSGYYNHGEAAISSEARRSLMTLKGKFADAIASGLEGKTIQHNGSSMSASQFYKEANGKYSQFREVYDIFAMPSKLGGDVKQISDTVTKMTGEKGFALEAAFGKLATAVGNDAEPILQRLQQLRAAKNLSDAYDASSGLTGVLKNILGGGPRDNLKRVADMTISKEKMARDYEKGLISKLPVSSVTKSVVESTAHALDFVNQLTPDNKMKMISNPVVLRKFYETITNAPQTQQNIYQQLTAPMNEGQ